MKRQTTRAQRYAEKAGQAVGLNIIPVCINFICDENLGFVIRSAACMGAQEVIVIGAIPKYDMLRRKSGNTSNFIKITNYQNPNQFLSRYRTDAGSIIVSAEMTDNSVSLLDFKYPKDGNIYLVIGHEEAGVPSEILLNSDHIVQIPLPGIGASLNVSHACSIMLYEFIRQKNINTLFNYY